MTARPLMIQGTMSGVGKSLLVAGLCRVMAQDGYRVVPFKSQNMALNSAVTREGLEMGRAQVMQAEAAGVEPSVAMNPVLLKPTTDVGSQVIVRGRPIGTMPAREYFAFRHTLAGEIKAAYDELARDADIVLIEGAGSPVELNLKRDDIVNMGVAKMVASPVLLAGDIDRGGVFAQLVGTMMLLDEDERRLVRATVVNKFRGDPTLFDTGLTMLAERTGVPVAGLVPYLPVDLDDEDSLSERLHRTTHHELLDIAVIRLPRISNFTDFIALEATDGVGVRYVDAPGRLGHPDLVIVPGTKATLADLRWLQDRGFGPVLRALADEGTPVLGICGGYQMLGRSVADPQGMEGGGEVAGLGLLPVRTTFGSQKRMARSKGEFCAVEGPLSTLAGRPVQGYELHMGSTVLEGGSPLLWRVEPDGTRVGEGCQCGSVYGCYLHGLFDRPEAAQGVVDALAAARGLEGASITVPDMARYRQEQYDLLADGIRASMDLDLVYRIIEEGV